MFCDYCGRDTPCASVLRDRAVTIHGVRIPIQYKTHICGCCGEEIFDEAVETKIMQIAQEQYRKKKSMLPAERLRKYMKENGLSPEEMAQKAECAVGEIIAASTGRLLDTNTDAKIKKGRGAVMSHQRRISVSCSKLFRSASVLPSSSLCSWLSAYV